MATSWVRALRCSRLQLAKQIRFRYMEKEGSGIQASPYRGASAHRWDMLGESVKMGARPFTPAICVILCQLGHITKIEAS